MTNKEKEVFLILNDWGKFDIFSIDGRDWYNFRINKFRAYTLDEAFSTSDMLIMTKNEKILLITLCGWQEMKSSGLPKDGNGRVWYLLKKPGKYSYHTIEYALSQCGVREVEYNDR